jgi:hypothetical protein
MEKGKLKLKLLILTASDPKKKFSNKNFIPLQARDQSGYRMLLTNPKRQMVKCQHLIYLPLQQENLHCTPEASSEGLYTHATTLH